VPIAIETLGLAGSLAAFIAVRTQGSRAGLQRGQLRGGAAPPTNSPVLKSGLP